MRLEITRIEGLRNDLLLHLDRSEIKTALLSVPHREQLLRLPGIPRHRAATPEEARELAASRITIDEHLRRLGIVDAGGSPVQRSVAISNRNLGTNHGNVAWQRTAAPRILRIREDPCDYGSYSCLTCARDGTLAIEDLRFDFDADRISRADTGDDLSDAIEWAVFGQQVLRRGRPAAFEQIAHQFYDIRHVLAFEAHRPEGEEVRRTIYSSYPGSFRENVRRAWHELGVPRARYVHNAVGICSDGFVILQREGTIEEIATALKAAGAEDGIILDNGGSVACWVWWTNGYRGGIVSPTVDYRPEGTSAIAIVLRGPVTIALPGGSVSPAAL